MSIIQKIIRIKERLIDLWTNYSLFKYAVIVHLGYFVVSLILVLTVLREQNDFLIYFTAGGVFYNDLNNLYNQDQYLWDYRYLPLSAVVFIPFYLLGFELGFIVFHFLNLLVNILICVILYKIIALVKRGDHEKDDRRVILFICIYLMAVPHMFNYILGQINSFVAYFVLLSLYIFLKYEKLKWQFFGSFILGISIIIKPVALFMIPFLLVINHDIKQRKKIRFDILKSALRLIGVIFPISLNLILFLLYPELWKGFVATNITGGNPLTLNFSFSISKLIVNFCYIYNIPFNQLIILIGVLIIIGGLGFIIYVKGKFEQNNAIIYGFTLGMLIMLLGYFDSWDHHLLILIPLLIIIIFNLPRNSEITTKFMKKSLIFFSFFDLAFMGIWFLTTPFWFPYNFASTIFLILVFYGIFKYGFNLTNKTKGD